MSIAKVSEISATSTKSFEAAIVRRHCPSEQDAAQRPQRVGQGAAGAREQWFDHRVSGQHDGDLRHRRLDVRLLRERRA